MLSITKWSFDIVIAKILPKNTSSYVATCKLQSTVSAYERTPSRVILFQQAVHGFNPADILARLRKSLVAQKNRHSFNERLIVLAYTTAVLFLINFLPMHYTQLTHRHFSGPHLIISDRFSVRSGKFRFSKTDALTVFSLWYGVVIIFASNKLTY